MCNLWFNIRFGVKHWQWGPNGMNYKVNPHQIKMKNDPNWKPFEVYTLFGFHID